MPHDSQLALAALLTDGLPFTLHQPEHHRASDGFFVLPLSSTVLLGPTCAHRYSNGLVSYFSDMWNVMDWLNYLIFFLVFMTMRSYLQLHGNVPCSPSVSSSAGADASPADT